MRMERYSGSVLDFVNHGEKERPPLMQLNESSVFCHTSLKDPHRSRNLHTHTLTYTLYASSVNEQKDRRHRMVGKGFSGFFFFYILVCDTEQIPQFQLMELVMLVDLQTLSIFFPSTPTFFFSFISFPSLVPFLFWHCVHLQKAHSTKDRNRPDTLNPITIDQSPL